MVSRLQGLGRLEVLSRRSVALAAGGAIMLALLPVGAAAQIPMSMPMGRNKPELTPEQQAKQKELEKAYKAAKEKIPEKNPADPWGGIRPASGATASAKKGKP